MTEGSEEVTGAWTPDGNAIVFCSNRSGDQQLWRVPSPTPSGGTFGNTRLRLVNLTRRRSSPSIDTPSVNECLVSGHYESG